MNLEVIIQNTISALNELAEGVKQIDDIKERVVKLEESGAQVDVEKVTEGTAGKWCL